MRSAAEILSDYRIHLQSTAPGRHYSTCPQCSDSRKKKGDKCLSVLIDETGVGFRCHHCDWSGGMFYRSSDRMICSTRIPQPRPTYHNDGKTEREHHRFALAIWDEAREPHGTIVERYLASRSLALPDNKALRFHPKLKFNGAYVGGMVAMFRDIKTNKPCGIHRTFLDGDGRKLDRKMLGRAGGAAIKLDADEDVTLGLHIGEGIETCLAAQLAGFRPVWALGGCGGISGFPVLPGIEAITVLGEINDGGANHNATEVCTARWIRAGREAFIINPLVGDDLNDVVMS
jgi:hypothetical protein